MHAGKTVLLKNDDPSHLPGITHRYAHNSPYFPNNDIIIYTDGPKQSDGSTGLGYCIQWPKHRRTKDKHFLIEKSHKLQDHNTVYQAEVAAIEKAIGCIQNVRSKNITIRSDSSSALQACIAPEISSNTVLKCVTALNKLGGRQNTIKLIWIKAHVGHEGNENADRLANLGCTSESEVNIPAPKSWIRKSINQYITEEWKTQWKEFPRLYRQTKHWVPEADQTRINPEQMKTLTRKDLGTLIRLYTGHNMLPKHKYLMNLTDSNVCKYCCEEDSEGNQYLGSSYHVVCRCQRFNELRAECLGRHQLDEVPEPKSQELLLHFLRISKIEDDLWFKQEEVIEHGIMDELELSPTQQFNVDGRPNQHSTPINIPTQTQHTNATEVQVESTTDMSIDTITTNSSHNTYDWEDSDISQY